MSVAMVVIVVIVVVSRGDGCDDGRHCDRHGDDEGDGDAKMSIMIGSNNSRAPCKGRKTEADSEFKGLRLYASITILLRI